MPRAKTGPKRPYVLNTYFDGLERELIIREAIERKVPQAEIVRRRILRRGWLARLEQLRKKQGWKILMSDPVGRKLVAQPRVVETEL